MGADAGRPLRAAERRRDVAFRDVSRRRVLARAQAEGAAVMPVDVGPGGTRTFRAADVAPSHELAPVERILLVPSGVDLFTPCSSCARFDGCPIRSALEAVEIRTRDLPPELSIAFTGSVDCSAFVPRRRGR